MIKRYLRRHPALNLFRIADLDRRYRRRAGWFYRTDGPRITSLGLWYTDRPPLLVLYADGDGPAAARRHLARIRPHLPRRLLMDLSPGLRSALAPRFTFRTGAEGPHARMVLADRKAIRAADTAGTRPLGRRDVPALRALYRRAYPATFFKADHLALGHAFGIRSGRRLVCAGGLLALSLRYGVAALGNIATDPAFRRRGFATKVTARICRSLARSIPLIGLCVLARNRPAICCYRRLGFRTVALTDVRYAVAR